MYLIDGAEVKSVAGFRTLESLAWGRVIYIDDLVTIPEEVGKGYGGALLDWVIEKAREEGYEELHLDSGYSRHGAHLLYLGRGLKLSSHHFSMRL